MKPFYKTVVADTILSTNKSKSWSFSRSGRRGTDGTITYVDNHNTAGTASDTALNDLERGGHTKLGSRSGSEADGGGRGVAAVGAGGGRWGSSATETTLKGHDFDDEKYGIEPEAEVVP